MSSRDDLGLRRALSDRMLPLLVAAMVFLAALSLAGAMQAQGIARHWQEGAASAATVQVSNPDQPLARGSDGPEVTRLEAVLRLLQRRQDLAQVRLVSGKELENLLRPWLGANADTTGLRLPGVIELRLARPDADLTAIARAVAAAAPGSSTESHDAWISRLLLLAHGLEACAYAVVLVVALVAMAVVMVATSAGLAARREAIDIVHGLGATDAYIAAQFSRRIAGAAALGGLLGALAALPVLIGITTLLAPLFGGAPVAMPAGMTDISPLWAAVPALPLAAWLIGYLTAQVTVRRWLRLLP
jgi:cell division transport system permease protein